MSAAVIDRAERSRRRFRLLELTVVVLALFPFSIFALRSSDGSGPRLVSTGRPGRAPVRRELTRTELRDRRARTQPTLADALLDVSIQLVWIGLAAWLGRRWFALRL